MGGRSVAARQAAQARAERMAAIAAREDEIERCLTRFLQARTEQEEVLATARARCAAVMERAGERAEAARADADAQVVHLAGLIKDREEVAERTGLSPRELRAVLRVDQGQVDNGAEAATADDVPAPEPAQERAGGERVSAPVEVPPTPAGTLPDGSGDVSVAPTQAAGPGTGQGAPAVDAATVGAGVTQRDVP
jgi:hypothetical protein